MNLRLIKEPGEKLGKFFKVDEGFSKGVDLMVNEGEQKLVSPKRFKMFHLVLFGKGKVQVRILCLEIKLLCCGKKIKGSSII